MTSFGKSARLWLTVVILAGLTLLVPADDDFLQLVRIEKSHEADGSVLDSESVDVLQELGSCLIARIPASGRDKIVNAGFHVSVITRYDRQTLYYLVFLPHLEDLPALQGVGSAVTVESNLAVFWFEPGMENRKALPHKLEIKVLPKHPVVRFHTAPVSPETETPWKTAAVEYNETIAGMVDSVSTDNLYTYVETLQNFQTRDAITQGCAQAGDYLHDFFIQQGLETEYDPFPFMSFDTRNVIATLPGITEPDKVVIIGAHYDSISWAGGAPGADDNGSGTACVMEASRILSEYSFDYTIKFICFSAEEYGLYGSSHYARAAQQREEDIVAVINLDMIAYADVAPENLDVISDFDSAWLMNTFTETGALYVDLEYYAQINPTIRYSDHSPFWDAGFDALLCIEDRDVPYPYIHTSQDLIEHLDFDFFTRSVQAAVATLAEVAGPIDSIPGDVNADGFVDAADVLVLSRFISDTETVVAGGDVTADLDHDNQVNAIDLVMLRLVVLGVL